MPAPHSTDAVVSESVRFSAGPFRLEGELVYPEEQRPVRAAVLAGPHPLLGGSMHNNVVRALGEGLAERGAVTLRFNYRGAGQSEGPRLDVAGQLAEFWRHSQVPSEHDFHHDLSAAVAFLRSGIRTNVPLALIGYSFGCTLLHHALPAEGAVPLVLIAPTIGTHDLDALTSVAGPKLVIAPEGDFSADDGRLQPWFERLTGPKELVRPRLDGHFFRRHEGWIVDTVDDFLDRH